MSLPTLGNSISFGAIATELGCSPTGQISIADVCPSYLINKTSGQQVSISDFAGLAWCPCITLSLTTNALHACVQVPNSACRFVCLSTSTLYSCQCYFAGRTTICVCICSGVYAYAAPNNRNYFGCGSPSPNANSVGLTICGLSTGDNVCIFNSGYIQGGGGMGGFYVGAASYSAGCPGGAAMCLWPGPTYYICNASYIGGGGGGGGGSCCISWGQHGGGGGAGGGWGGFGSFNNGCANDTSCFARGGEPGQCGTPGGPCAMASNSCLSLEFWGGGGGGGRCMPAVNTPCCCLGFASSGPGGCWTWIGGPGGAGGGGGGAGAATVCSSCLCPGNNIYTTYGSGVGSNTTFSQLCTGVQIMRGGGGGGWGGAGGYSNDGGSAQGFYCCCYPGGAGGKAVCLGTGVTVTWSLCGCVMGAIG